MREEVRSVRCSVGLVARITAVLVIAGCGSSHGGFGSSGFDAGLGGADATTGLDAGSDGTVIKLGGHDSSSCVPSTCSELKANCGDVTDPKCGGVVPCGSCSTGETCGGGGVHNQCGNGAAGEGGVGDGCAKLTCAGQHVTCGATGDGCGGTLQCGTCALPQTCGGNPMAPGECGCTGVCAQVPTCESGTTTLTGKVFDPAGKNGLYNALVYVPNDPTDPGLMPFAAGITCDVCGSTAAGDPLVTAYTAPDGSFTLSGVPVGTSIPLVIQLGRWRRQFTLPITNACTTNTVPAGTTLSMPANHTEGDLPRIAIVTGQLDPVECLLRKAGVDDSEFTNPGQGGYINFFTADGYGAGSVITTGGGTTPTQDNLFAATGGPSNGPLINNYDMVVMECEGYPQPQTAAQETALAAYAGAGGRVFASDFQYTWFYQEPNVQTAAPAFPGVADWAGGNHGGSPLSGNVIGVIDQPPTNPIGQDFQEWLQDVGASTAGSGTVELDPVFGNLAGTVTAPTQEWLHYTMSGVSAPILFTFNTPIGAASANQCGRVTFSDWHAESDVDSSGSDFPAECPSTTMNSQEAILEFLIFDLSACVQPYTPVCTPTTCQALGIECGPAGDGCGGLINGSTDGGTGTGCGVCPSGQTCGGGGAGKCGSTVTCMPETCASQGLQCGPAGDGCGNEIQCGNCPTGDICGLTKAGQCGSTSK